MSDRAVLLSAHAERGLLRLASLGNRIAVARKRYGIVSTPIRPPPAPTVATSTPTPTSFERTPDGPR